MDWWVDGEIMQVRQLQAFNPTLFFFQGSHVMAALCLWEAAVRLYGFLQFLKKSQHGEPRTRLNVRKWETAVAR